MAFRLSARLILIGALSIAAPHLSTAGWWSNLRDSFSEARPAHEWLVTGYSSKVIDARDLDLRYAGFHYRYFWELEKEEEPGPWSVFVGAFAETVVVGPGSYLIGGSIGLRWSHPVEALGGMAYAQISVGVFGNDIYKDYSQLAIGSFIEFRDNFTMGLAWPLSPDGGPSLHLELAVEHISNGGIDPRNNGINLAGLSLGLHY